jgi:hypothetical protein
MASTCKAPSISYSHGGPNGSIRFELEWNENRGITKLLKVVDTIFNAVGMGMDLSFADCIAYWLR